MSASRKLSAVAMAVALAACVIAAMCLATPVSAASMSSQLQRKREAQAQAQTRLQTMNEAEATAQAEPTGYPYTGAIPVVSFTGTDCGAKMKAVHAALKNAPTTDRVDFSETRVIGVAKINSQWNFAVSGGGLTKREKEKITRVTGTTWNFPNVNRMYFHPSCWHCAAQQLVVFSKQETGANPTCLAEMRWKQDDPAKPVLAKSCSRCRDRLLTVEPPVVQRGRR